MNKKLDRLGRRLEKRVIRPLVRPLYVDLNPEYRNTVFLAGTEKSGTTWISDIINYKREYRYIFEPFWSARVPICKGFKPYHYLRPDDDDRYFVEAARTILSGRIRSQWTDKYHRRFIAHQRLIKDIRANLFLKWMYNHFPEVPIILLLRHPCAVARSHLRRTHRSHSLDAFLAQEDLIDDYLRPILEEMETAQTDFEKLIFRWCIETYVPLKQFKKGQVHLAFYEHFCEHPESEIDGLFSFLDRDYDEAVYKQLRRPSPVARGASAIISGGSLIDAWRQQITDEQTQRAVEILSLFGLDKIYSHDSMPNAKKAYALLETVSTC
jgi:hypothetical protein